MSTPATPAFPVVSSNDFVTLVQVKTWIESMMPGTVIPDDDVLHFIITGVSTDMLNRMSRKTILQADYQEWYDGTGSATLPIDQNPIVSVNVLRIGNFVIPPSPDHIQYGYIVSKDQKFIQLIGGSGPLTSPGGLGINRSFGRSCSPVFPYAISNVYIDYYAGYATIPYDLAEACLLIIDQDYKRRGWPDKAQIAIPNGGGTTTYQKWEIPPRAARILNTYTRTYRF